MKHAYIITLLAAAFCSCDPTPETSDDKQRAAQEVILQEGTAAIGMPAIKNFREKRLVKTIIEMRDQEGLVTYTYIYSAMTGKFTFIGETIGYGIPYATQFTNPQKYDRVRLQGGGWSYQTLPQADPNGLFSPASADASWILMRDPKTGNVTPQYIEERLCTFSYRLPDSMLGK